jgi:hypothetical protein
MKSKTTIQTGKALSEAASLIESALDLLNQSHVKDNQWRLGALGSGDIDTVKRYLVSAKEKMNLDTVNCR